MTALTAHLVLATCRDLWNCSEAELMNNGRIAKARREHALTVGLQLGIPANVMAAATRQSSIKVALEIAGRIEGEARTNPVLRATLWSLRNACRCRVGDPRAAAVI